MAIRSIWFLFLVLTLVVFLHAKARELPKPKNLDNQKKDEVVVAPEKSTNVIVTNTNNPNPAKDVAKGTNDDDKHFISFAGVGAAGGVGGAAGIIPIDFQGLGPGIPTFGGLGGSGLGGGTGGGIGGGAGGGGGCTPGSSSTGGLVPIP